MVTADECDRFVPVPFGAPVGGVARVPAALLVADLSGYTRLSERFAALGRSGTEQLTEVLDERLGALVDCVKAEGGDVVRLRGDGLLVAFVSEGDVDRRRAGHAAAVRAARAMQRSMRERPALDLPGGRVRLRQSIAVHHGDLVVVRWDGPWWDEVVLGPAVTAALHAEAAAATGTVSIGAGPLPAAGPPVAARAIRVAPSPSPVTATGRHGRARLPADLVDALGDEPEHRDVAVGFVRVLGLDALCAGDHDGELVATVHEVLDVIASESLERGVLPVATDVAPDGFAVELLAGAPAARGDEAARLLATAWRVVDRLGRRVAAGVHAGPVFVGPFGHPEARTFAALGDTTNVAARLAQRAGAGELVTSAEVLDDVGARYELRARDHVTVRGRRRPVDAAVVGAPRPPRRPREGAPPLRGRERELAAVVDALAGPGARVVEVVGPAGIGKSRLVEEVVHRLGRTTWLVTGTVDGAVVPFGAADQLLAMAGVDGPLQEQRHEPGPGAESAGERVAAATAARLTGALVDGVLVVLDGIDSLDASSRRVVERFVAGAERDVGIVVTHRGSAPPLAVDTSEPGRVAVARVALGTLGDDAVRAVVLDAAGAPLGDHEVGRIVARAAGVPRLARRLGRLGRVDGDLPTGLEAVVAAELDQLPAATRRLVRVAAHVGGELDATVLADVSHRPLAEVLAALTVATHVLRPVPPSSGEQPDAPRHRFRFRDDAVRRVAADGMAVRERRVVQRRTADALTRWLGADAPLAAVVRVAWAWHAAADDERTLEWCRRAGEGALAIGAPHEAADLLWVATTAAHRLRRPVDEVVTLAEAVADAAAAAGLPDRGGEALSLASAVATEPARRAQLLARRARHASRLGRARSASALAAAAERLAATLGDGDEGRRVRLTVGLERTQVCFDQGRYDEADARARALVTDATSVGHRRQLAQALALAEMTASVLGHDGADELGQRAHALAEEVGDLLLAGAVACNVGLGFDNRGRWPEALDWYRRAEDHFTAVGSGWSVALAALNRSTILAELGDVDGALDACRDAQRELAAAGVPALALAASSHRARLRARAGHAAPAAVVGELRDAVTRLHELGEEETACFRHAALVEVLLLAGDVTGARREATALVAAASMFGAGHLLPVTAARLHAWTLAAAGRHDDAVAAARDARDAAVSAGLLPEVWACRQALTVLGAADDGCELEQLTRELGAMSVPWFRVARSAST